MEGGRRGRTIANAGGISGLECGDLVPEGRKGNFACLYDRQTHQVQQVGNGIQLCNVHVSPDGRYVAYVNGGVLFVHDDRPDRPRVLKST